MVRWPLELDAHEAAFEREIAADLLRRASISLQQAMDCDRIGMVYRSLLEMAAQDLDDAGCPVLAARIDAALDRIGGDGSDLLVVLAEVNERRGE